jgi:hypothetical protein
MKLSQLTPEQKTKMLAELRNQTWKSSTNLRFPTCQHCKRGLSAHIDQRWCPDFNTNSYDTIIPLVQKLPQDIKTKFGEICFLKLGHPFGFFDMTPSQIGDEVLVATGKAEV